MTHRRLEFDWHAVFALVCALAVVLTAAGCKNNPVVMQQQITSLQQQQQVLAQQSKDLQGRAATLDQDNQELETLLAQSQQQSRIYEDQARALREQLSSANAQLADARQQHRETEAKAKTYEASLRRRGGAEIRANNSLSGALPSIQIAGVEARQDGDVIRVELPGSRLFTPGSAHLLPDAVRLIDDVAEAISRQYPGQLVGVEGHTDSDPIQSGQWANNHQLSTARAMAVFDQLTARGRFRADQLFLVGHGSNQPVVSNATPAGKERNRRVELVIYPEQAGKR